jgi:hypothetical protein
VVVDKCLDGARSSSRRRRCRWLRCVCPPCPEQWQRSRRNSDTNPAINNAIDTISNDKMSPTDEEQGRHHLNRRTVVGVGIASQTTAAAGGATATRLHEGQYFAPLSVASPSRKGIVQQQQHKELALMSDDYNDNADDNDGYESWNEVHHSADNIHATQHSNNNKSSSSSSRLRHQLRAFHTMSIPYFTHSPRGRRLFCTMIILTLLNSAVRVFFSYLARDFWSALSDQREDDFYNIMGRFVGAMVVLAPISVVYRYQRQVLAIEWRKWLTGRVLRLYFGNRVYYALERQFVTDDGNGGATTTTANDSNATTATASETTREVDNPDQRISEDIRSFTEFSLSFFLTLVTSIIDLIAFSFILFSIMPQLFIAIFAFASLGTVLTVCIGKGLIRLNYDSLQREADFRFSLVRVRENAESIAFYGGEAVEERETERRFGRVIENMILINLCQMRLDFMTTSYNYLTWILPIGEFDSFVFICGVWMDCCYQRWCDNVFNHQVALDPQWSLLLSTSLAM